MKPACVVSHECFCLGILGDVSNHFKPNHNDGSVIRQAATEHVLLRDNTTMMPSISFVEPNKDEKNTASQLDRWNEHHGEWIFPQITWGKPIM